MNKLAVKFTSLCVCGTLTLCSITAAITLKHSDLRANYALKNAAAQISDNMLDLTDGIFKDETVYVLAGADGSVKKIIVSDWVKNPDAQETLEDKTELKNIENVKGNESYTLGGDNMAVWDAAGGDIYYKGNAEKELPVALSVSYKLDGKPVTAGQIAGKSGKVTVRFDYQNRQYKNVSLNGENTRIYVPFVMLTGMLLDNKSYKNIEVSGGKLINDGDRTVVIGTAFPGLQSNLGISRDKFVIPDHVEITADVKNFKLGVTVTVATNEIFSAIDTSKLNFANDLISSGEKLNAAIKQLTDGADALYGGLCTLLEKSSSLVDGINLLSGGAKAVSDGAKALDDGSAALLDGMNALSAGLSTLSGNSAALNSGAKQVFDTLLATANSQLDSAGLNVPTLTTDNYSEVLNGVIASLDETAVYNTALSEVTAAVEANRPAITAAVTTAVRDQVLEQIIPAATGGAMTKESYDAAVGAGLVDAATIGAINAAADAQMEGDAIKALIVENTNLKVNQLISENMASDAVTSKLAAASAGATAVIGLKTSLDSYNAFYLGLLTYTGGVDSAAAGAQTLASGAQTLKDGTGQLKDGAIELYNGALQIKDGVPTLISGIGQLKDGAEKLKDGLDKFNAEGIQKIVALLGDDLGGVLTRLKATIEVSKSYRNFSGIPDNADGKVRFIWRTDEVK